MTPLTQVAPPTLPAARPVPRSSRVIGVDVARGVALFGMLATHVVAVVNEKGDPTTATVIAAGRSAATFVLIAGVGLAFISGGRHVVQGPERTAVAGGLVVRALLIGAIGLALGALAPFNDVEGILPFYALLFLLAIPLIGLPPRLLAGIAAGFIVLGPVVLVATAPLGLPYARTELDPGFGILVQDPLGLLVQLLVTGEYPLLVYLAYLCAGLAIGRLDLTSRRVGWWLLGGGVALAVAARSASALLLYPFGGLDALLSTGASDVSTLLWEAQVLLAEARSPISWWYLALPAPHSHTPVDLLHTLGSAGAVLGAALLLTRVPVLARALSPVAAAGAMALTLYSAHLVLLATGVLRGRPAALYLLMVLGAMAFAMVWRRWIGQGPLERIVAAAAGATRRHLAARLGRRGAIRGSSARRPTVRGAAQFLVPLACAGLLLLALVGGSRIGAHQDEAVAPVADTEPVPAAAATPVPTAPPGPAIDAEAAGPQPDEETALEEDEAAGDTVDEED
ncbi:heparan-alpha-glucosaminide N-acetyltransferase domain-containing protein [Pseudonocardia alaniniphila]|uniref:Heparan-alpha-glucosaminide N-acetyltransferase domain-containing protein n=1 Tax=Pseudonocardia alaniniphila TaxID=75291 RepID=A0ABS9T6E7_9PSEU|nr:heparan-alpha-glucosaminide N-acetyltransferase domain-containing protein [Pseudonocardia alaniniphila]MCH6164102.1 heparan-alpha-glucosaminide N-acetyltransferase domain-containing protein [Pseudonocardia alaniniphila]